MNPGHPVSPFASDVHPADTISSSSSLLCTNWTGHYCHRLTAFFILAENMASHSHAGRVVCHRQRTPFQPGLVVSRSMVRAEEGPCTGHHVGCEKRHWGGTALRSERLFEPIWLEYHFEGLDRHHGMTLSIAETFFASIVGKPALPGRPVLTTDSADIDIAISAVHEATDPSFTLRVSPSSRPRFPPTGHLLDATDR